MPRPYPQEFREDVIRVARNRGPGDQLKTIAADVEDGIKPGTTATQNEELKTAKRCRDAFQILEAAFSDHVNIASESEGTVVPVCLPAYEEIVDFVFSENPDDPVGV